MAYALVSHVTVPGTQNGTTSAAIDTTGANILFFALGRHAGTAAPTISDSKGNTWIARTSYESANVGSIRIYYVVNPTVGTGHTFTISGSSSFSSACVAAFSGADTSAPFDVENGNTVNYPSGSTIQTGALLPSQDNSLVLTALGTAANGGPSGYTVDLSFTITDTVNALDNQAAGTGLAYLVETTATSKNPTWTIAATGSAFGIAATIASFKPGGAAPTKAPPIFHRPLRIWRRAA